MHTASDAASSSCGLLTCYCTDEQRHNVIRLCRDELYQRNEAWYSPSSWEDRTCVEKHTEYVNAKAFNYALKKLEESTKSGLEYMLRALKDPRIPPVIRQEKHKRPRVVAVIKK